MAGILNRMDGSWDGAADPPLASMLSLLVPEGVASLECSAADEARLRSALLFAGFVQIASGACAPGAGGAVRVRVTASKPAWEVGAAARLPGGAARLGTARLGAAPAVTATPAASTRVMLDDDLVDEDALMDDLPVPAPAAGGCATKKRACADCTCGRKELEATGDQAAADAMPADTSACGNCSKGDAFRCASCPHLGKPAFEPGQENVTLNLDQDDF